MPDTAAPRLYWDSNVFLNYINETPDKIEVLDQLLLNARHGEVEILTSVLTVVEVAFAANEKANGHLDPAVEQKIRALWEPAAPVELVEFHFLLAEDSRALIRNALGNGWSLKPYDAVHLATAKRMRVATVHTYEDKWERYSGMVACAIEKPSAAQVGMFPPTSG
jgi:predicted nucleic acid-binding protein